MLSPICSVYYCMCQLIRIRQCIHASKTNGVNIKYEVDDFHASAQ
jgi:hypothetical protein